MKTSNKFHSGSVSDREQKLRKRTQSVDHNLDNSLAILKEGKTRQLSVHNDVIQQNLILEVDTENEKDTYNKKTGSKVLISTLLFSVMIMWTLYGNIATFYPPYKNHHHSTVTDTMVGLVLAMMEVGILVSSPLISMILQKVGRKNFILIGHIVMIMSSIGFGLLVYVESDSAFFWVSIGLRFFQGFGDACASIAIFSIIGTDYSADQELYFGYLEAAVGVGLMLGPVIGQLIYNQVGFEKTFYCTAIIITGSLILQLFIIPQRLNHSVGQSQDQTEDQKNSKLTFKIFLTNKRAMMASFSAMLAMIFMLFYDTIYSNYLLSIGVSEDYIGYFFALACGVYSFSAPLVGYLSKFIAKVYLTQFAFIMSFVSLIMFGPSQLLNFPQSIPLMLVGSCLGGFSVSFIFVPLLAEIIEVVKEKENIPDDDEYLNEQVSDLSSGLFNTSYALGCLVAPILGGAFNDRYGFRATCDIFAFSSLGYALIYFCLNTLPYVLDKSKKK